MQVTIKEDLVDLDKVRSGIQEMLKQAWGCLYRLTGGKQFADKLPAEFKDDLTNETRDYSFLDHGPFTMESHPLMTYLINESPWKFASIDAKDRLSFNMPAVHGYLDACSDLNDILCVLSYLLPIMANRISQFVGNTVRNMDRHHNTNMLITEMVYFTGYHKMSNTTGIDVCIPAFVPPALKALMLEYLCGGIHQMEEIFSGIAYGKTAAKAFHSYVFISCPLHRLSHPCEPQVPLGPEWGADD